MRGDAAWTASPLVFCEISFNRTLRHRSFFSLPADHFGLFKDMKAGSRVKRLLKNKVFLTMYRDFFVNCNAFRTPVVWAGDCIYMNWRFTTLDLTVKTSQTLNSRQ